MSPAGLNEAPPLHAPWPLVMVACARLPPQGREVLCGRPRVAPWTVLATLAAAAGELGGSRADSAAVWMDLNAGRAVGGAVASRPMCVRVLCLSPSEKK